MLGKVRAQKTLKKGDFMDAESTQKSLTSQNEPQIFGLIVNIF